MSENPLINNFGTWTSSVPSAVSSSTAASHTDVSFGDALWNLRSVDVVLQGLVVMTVALGIAIVLHQKKRHGEKQIGDQ